MESKLSSENILLVALASCGDQKLSPIQLQKLLFLIDKKIGDRLGGPFFHFEPYHYGPFDKGVYYVAESLAQNGLLQTIAAERGRYNYYHLTPKGSDTAKRILKKMPSEISEFLSTLGQFVITRHFKDLLRSIYAEYPDMAVKSIFRD